jgi:hypothetical protein
MDRFSEQVFVGDMRTPGDFDTGELGMSGLGRVAWFFSFGEIIRVPGTNEVRTSSFPCEKPVSEHLRRVRSIQTGCV